jgi:4-alpha-glucanotransferase
LLAVLQAMGAPVAGWTDVPDALRHRRQELWRRRLEPVVVAWKGRLAPVALRVPATVAGRSARCSLVLEEGDPPVTWETVVGGERVEVESVAYVEARIAVPKALPEGYHTLSVELDGEHDTSMVVSSSGLAAQPSSAKTWGAFLPLYAMRSERSLGIADFTDLESLLRWVRELGGQTVATLPLLAAFLDEPFDPSPYSPASRLFWNELYVDLAKAPELDRCEEARSMVASGAVRSELGALRDLPLVDYRRTMTAKRKVLEALAACLFAGSGGRRNAFETFARANPALEDYARFRAACDRYRTPWREWPTRDRQGSLPAATSDERSFHYHLYAQWLAAEQLERAAGDSRQGGSGLYFDLPLGVNPSGYDVWREREAFLDGVSAGAPPDPFFFGGQNWGFPPLSPEGIRQQRYRYPIACLRHLLRLAGVVRVDHVMGLHRLFVLPDGMHGDHGVYIRYRPEELYAILTLESKRTQTVVVGEDLGVVPAYVRRAMARHGLYRSHVLEVEMSTHSDATDALAPVPAGAVASLNTHDLPPFAAFWEALDDSVRAVLVESLRRRGLLGDRAEERDVLGACLGYLASSPARMMVVNLEDLWLEADPQNVPGTTDERPNWRRRARLEFETFRSHPDVAGTLQRVDRMRRQP